MSALLPLAAVAAGVVSASSPCVLPVIPGYLSAVSTGSPHDPDAPHRPSMTGAIGFVVGFSIVFSALGATASALGALLYTHLDIALKIAGGALILLGLHGWGLGPIGLLNRDLRLRPDRVGVGTRRSVLLGSVFALGWTPCIGPVLATVLSKAAASHSLTQGTVLLILYSAGLGLPFLAIAFWFERSRPMRRWLARRAAVLQRITASTLVLVGIGYLTGAWSTVFSGAQAWLARRGWPPI
jgi:cytochrome c-type biogenesis protein